MILDKNAFSTRFQGLFPPLARRILENGWQGVFRHVILELLPVAELSQHFHPSLGAPYQRTVLDGWLGLPCRLPRLDRAAGSRSLHVSHRCPVRV